MIEMVEGTIAAAEHGTMPETKKFLGSDDVGAELKDGVEDSGMGVLVGVLGDMHLNAVTKDGTKSMMVQTTGGTLASDIAPSDTSVEESIVEEGASGDDEPEMSGFFTKESTICVSESVDGSLVSDILEFSCYGFRFNHIHILNSFLLSKQARAEASVKPNSTVGNSCIAVNCTSTHVSLASIVCI